MKAAFMDPSRQTLIKYKWKELRALLACLSRLVVRYPINIHMQKL